MAFVRPAPASAFPAAVTCSGVNAAPVHGQVDAGSEAAAAWRRARRHGARRQVRRHERARARRVDAQRRPLFRQNT